MNLTKPEMTLCCSHFHDLWETFAPLQTQGDHLYNIGYHHQPWIQGKAPLFSASQRGGGALYKGININKIPLIEYLFIDPNPHLGYGLGTWTQKFRTGLVF